MAKINLNGMISNEKLYHHHKSYILCLSRRIMTVFLNYSKRYLNHVQNNRTIDSYVEFDGYPAAPRNYLSLTFTATTAAATTTV